MSNGHYGIGGKGFKNLKIILAISLVMITVYRCKNPKIEADYYNPDILATHASGEQFVGSATCIECHSDVYASHIKTAHYNTSAKADSISVKGSFEAESNTLDLESVAFTMISDGDQLYQHTEIKNRHLKKAPAKFDIVIGSGVRGQSYLTWKNDSLYQLQPSYYTASDDWVNSPGFPSYYLERPVRGACVKCHVTFAKNEADNKFDRGEWLYGVDCERCHRPAAKHVRYHKNNPEEINAKFIMKFSDLTQQQRLDVCAQCHSGLRGNILKGNSFSFLVGDDLDQHAQNFNSPKANDQLDVHGNQYGLLIKSACFQKTETMDCSTCHSPHENQRGNTAFFNQKCMTCHSSEDISCGGEITERNQMGDNCIACHMPTTPSKTMMVQLVEDSLETSFNIRTHLIAIYQKESLQNE